MTEPKTTTMFMANFDDDKVEAVRIVHKPWGAPSKREKIILCIPGQPDQQEFFFALEFMFIFPEWEAARDALLENNKQDQDEARENLKLAKKTFADVTRKRSRLLDMKKPECAQ